MGGILSVIWRQAPEKPVLDGLGFPTSVTVDFEVSAAREKLAQLLRASLVSHRLSRIAQPLTAAFYLGASPAELVALFEEWVPKLCTVWPDDDPVDESVGKFNLEEFFGHPEYEERYYDYFRDCLTEELDWPSVVKMHMEQLGARLVNNDFRPLIELATALETDNGLIAAEALAMASTDPEAETAPQAAAVDDTSAFTMFIRSTARAALRTEDFTAVCATQAQCELFLSEKERLIDLPLEFTLLRYLNDYIRSRAATPTNPLPKVAPVEALASKDPDLIQYTRARMVLEIIAV